MEASHNRENNLNFLRFVAATIVVFGHSQALVGDVQTQVLRGSIAPVGVMIFFAISGFLITDSWERRPSLITFFSSRCLRIFPALVIVTILSSLVLGALVTSLSPKDYFSNIGTWEYFWNILLYVTYSLPGVFEHNIAPHAVNGSLWSLPPEFLCYVIVSLIGTITIKYRIHAYICLAIIIAFMCFYYPIYRGPQLVFYGTDIFQAANVMIYFMVGALIRLLKIPLNVPIAVAGLALNFWLPSQISSLGPAVNWITVSYFVLAFGFKSTPLLNSWGKPGDFSYGIYLYSFPIQQTLGFITENRLSAVPMFLFSFVLALAFAVASWHLVEAPSLKLKRYALPAKKNNIALKPM
ncbi:acyltransferase [Phyllobacterium sp. UNC302MFCol5.2]|uniref:acyltransferase family protein n=1 Tax=Phyllobacterium sp. UNC302MFCol5.2 TaxID=1449065 RepID=UPI0004893D7E|nr:acyltransferase [Phyllobacterium sp. UNC302MFCol5.2]